MNPPDPADIILGTAHPPYPHPQFRLAPREQAFHGLIWGSTGTGKSKLLQSLFLQHLNKGRGVCLIDPHGDLSRGCLAYLTAKGFFKQEEAAEKLVYLDFGAGGPVPFNVLNTPHDPHTRALNALEALTRTWPDLQGAPLFRTLFLSAAMVLVENDLPLTELNHLLLDGDFRSQCLSAVSDPLVHQTFAFYDKHGKGQAGSTLRRAFLLSFSPVTRGSLGQTENVLNIRQLMDQGTSLIINLGSIADPITRRLFGSLVMVQIEQAALSRSNVPENRRRPWACLVDEWPVVAATQGQTLENVLTQTRKYNLRLYLAAQALAQVDSSRLSGALEQCRLSVSFRLGPDSARIQAKHIAMILPRSDEAPSRSEQMQLWVQALTDLPPRQAFVKVHGRKLPTRITTLNVPEPELDPLQLEAVLELYQKHYHAAPAVVSPLERELSSSFTDTPALSEMMTVEETFRGAPSLLDDFGRFFGEPDDGHADT